MGRANDHVPSLNQEESTVLQQTSEPSDLGNKKTSFNEYRQGRVRERGKEEGVDEG
jgi:hypothetical protein